ncbi:MAG: hypothetical protein F6K00_17640 [Leptolyngbya sp. SIOISBB]|nr:hypothetical protein [Leptolyngbya sp. SIOISBB]
MADLVEKYPDVKDKILEVSKIKFKHKDEGFDVHFTESSTKTFMWFGEGLKMIKALLDQILIAKFATEEVVASVIKTFSSAVATDDFVFKSYHDSDKKYEKYEVKEIFTGKSPSFEIAYLFLSVSARKKSGFLHNKSTTKVESKIKVKKFANIQGLFEWASEE